ncbi:MAG: hypothetical protein ACOCVL_00655 [Candidatus Sumerlaeota bacterium]
MPEVLVTHREEWRRIQNHVVFGDYVLVWQGEVAEEQMLICVKRGALPAE